MVSRIQGLDAAWTFSGRKTHRPIGNAFPLPVAQSVGSAIRRDIGAGEATGMKHRRIVA